MNALAPLPIADLALDYGLGDSREEMYERVRRFGLPEMIEHEQEAGMWFGPAHRYWHLQRAPEKVRKLLELAAKRPHVQGARQGFAAMDVADFPPSSFSPVTASATETNLWTQTVWTPIPAGDMRAGKVYKVSFGGVFTSTGTQGTLTWTPREGTSGTPGSNHTLGASGAIAPAASITAGPWFGEFTVGIRTTDIALTSITGTGNGLVVTHAGTATGTMYPMGGTVASNISNAAATALILSLTISVASQSYTCQWALIRSYN